MVTFDCTAPIIIVGAGRSGTTRLVGTLGEHPDVYMINETSFLLPRLWAVFNERPEYVRSIRLGQLARQTKPEWRATPFWAFWRDELRSDLSTLGPLLTEIESDETARLQLAFGAFFAETLIPPSLRRARWGFKEIWAGGEAFPYDWGLYRAAFPNARYVQSIRHPFDYLSSAIAVNRTPAVTDDYIVHALGQWVAMVRHARTLRDTGRYIEFRMEEFDRELPRVLDALELPRHAACDAAAQFRYLPSARQPVPISDAAIDRVAGLRELADELQYELGAEVALSPY